MDDDTVHLPSNGADIILEKGLLPSLTDENVPQLAPSDSVSVFGRDSTIEDGKEPSYLPLPLFDTAVILVTPQHMDILVDIASRRIR